MKQCSRCKTHKSLDEFNKGKDSDDRHRWCRQCCKAYYRIRSTHHKALVRKNSIRYRAERTQKIGEYLYSHGCADCGIKDIRVLDFDHLRDKIDDVDRIGPWDQVLKEIEKCEVVCSNCHRIRTESRREKSWRTEFMAALPQ